MKKAEFQESSYAKNLVDQKFKLYENMNHLLNLLYLIGFTVLLLLSIQLGETVIGWF